MVEKQETETRDAGYVTKRYNEAIDYYWAASAKNKRAYKTSRNTTVILGSALTLVASLSAMSVVERIPALDLTFAIATPVLAAIAAVAGGLSQSFQWGAAWYDMVLTAQELEKERDDYMMTPASERNDRVQLALLNRLVMEESRGFFGRILGAAKTSVDARSPASTAEQAG